MAGCGIRFDMAQVSRQIEESISILNFFPPNRGVDFYFEFLPAKSSVVRVGPSLDSEATTVR